jgi:hypothetical protein
MKVSLLCFPISSSFISFRQLTQSQIGNNPGPAVSPQGLQPGSGSTSSRRERGFGFRLLESAARKAGGSDFL